MWVFWHIWLDMTRDYRAFSCFFAPEVIKSVPTGKSQFFFYFLVYIYFFNYLIFIYPPIGIFQEHIGILQEYIGIFQEYILRLQKENIFLHKQTKEASICKSGFPKKRGPELFIKRNRRFLVMRSAIDHFFVEKSITRGSICATF